MYVIDGQALDADSFGELDSTWKPIAYAGTYGTNGFFQDYSNSADLGEDSSGNENDYTVTNIDSGNQSTDTPTNPA